MTAANPVPPSGTRVQALTGFLPAGGFESAEEGLAVAVPIALDAVTTAQWTHSVIAEGATGEVAGAEGFDLDEDDGIVWNNEFSAEVQVDVEEFDLRGDELTGAEADDLFTVVVLVNNDIALYADEGFVGEFDDTEQSQEFHVSGKVRLEQNDVLRVAVVTEESSEDDLYLRRTENAVLTIV